MTPFGKALIKARKLIENRYETYICHALRDIGGAEFRQEIINRLDGCPTYESWLLNTHPHVLATMDITDRQQGRLQWMDYMIEQERAK